MKRKPFIITVFIILAIATAVWVYQNSTPARITSWDLIGKDAVAVFEINRPDSFFEKLRQLPNLNRQMLVSETISQLSKSQVSKAYIVLSPIAIDDFDFLLYLESVPQPSLFVENIKSNLQGEISIRKRNYNGVEIAEYGAGSNGLAISVAIIEDIILISGSSFLLEGAVKLRNGDQFQLFKASNETLFKLPTLQSDEGNIYVNAAGVIDFASVFLESSNRLNSNGLSGSALVDLKVNNSGLLMNGFFQDGSGSLVSLFNNQKPQPFDIQSIISNKVALVSHYGVSNVSDFFARQKAYLAEKNLSVQDSLVDEMSSLSIDIESMKKDIGNQIANCRLGKGEGDVFVMRLNESTGTVTILDEMASKISERNKDSLYLENYAGYSIKLIDHPDFLYQLFFPLASRSSQSFFARIGRDVIFAESVDLLKAFIDDIESENTWGKSVEWSNFLGSAIQESNINFYFDGKLLSAALKDRIRQKWKPLLDSTDFLFLDKGSVQLSRLESNYYANASFIISNEEHKKSSRSLEKITFGLENALVCSPNIVRNHSSKDVELLVQDSLNNIYLLSRDLKILWKEKCSDRIRDDVEQLDYYSNGKLQYFFTTDGEIHLTDRLGRDVQSFPKKLSTRDVVEYSTVVDYDRSKRYRYLISDAKGNLYLTDKDGALLDGWNPLIIGEGLMSSARHYRVLGKDYFLAVTRTGVVHLRNRRGESLRGFPLKLGFRPAGNVSITTAATLKDTHFTIVSGDGVKTQFDLNGQVRNREVLLKRSGNSQFELLKSRTEESYVILRVDPSKIAVLDEGGNLVFELENAGSTDWQLSFIENRLRERFYCLYDRQQDFSYFFDSAGKSLLPQPLESSQLPSLYFEEKNKSLYIYNVFEKSISLVSIDR